MGTEVSVQFSDQTGSSKRLYIYSLNILVIQAHILSVIRLLRGMPNLALAPEALSVDQSFSLSRSLT